MIGVLKVVVSFKKKVVVLTEESVLKRVSKRVTGKAEEASRRSWTRQADDDC